MNSTQLRDFRDIRASLGDTDMVALADRAREGDGAAYTACWRFASGLVVGVAHAAISEEDEWAAYAARSEDLRALEVDVDPQADLGAEIVALRDGGFGVSIRPCGWRPYRGVPGEVVMARYDTGTCTRRPRWPVRLGARIMDWGPGDVAVFHLAT